MFSKKMLRRLGKGMMMTKEVIQMMNHNHSRKKLRFLLSARLKPKLYHPI